MKFWDNSGAEGDYSTTTASFSLGATAPATSTSGIQKLMYYYDNVGNITVIEDYSNTDSKKTVVFGYDDLHRLTSASTTIASTTPFSQTYTYSNIGNITNKSDVGSYTYAGTGYANPHAATTIDGVTYSYDNNGDLTGFGSTAYTWDYRDRLTRAGTELIGTLFFAESSVHKDMQLKLPHNGTEAEGVARVKQMLNESRAKIAESATDVKEEWSGNVLAFGFTAQGQRIEGTLTVRNKEFDLYAKLPLTLRLFEGTIERMLQAEAAKLRL